jgi:hypothetical protein
MWKLLSLQIFCGYPLFSITSLCQDNAANLDLCLDLDKDTALLDEQEDIAQAQPVFASFS